VKLIVIIIFFVAVLGLALWLRGKVGE